MQQQNQPYNDHTRQFQIHFSEQKYYQLYDDTEREWFQQKEKKQIYTLRQRGIYDKQYVAKKYKYKKDKYIDKIWNEVNSVIKMRNHDHPHVIRYQNIFMFDLYQDNTDYQVCIMVMEKGDYTLEEFVNTAIKLENERQLQQIEEQTDKKNKKPNQQQLQQHYENLVYQYLKQTLSGCKFLKSKNIYHRDYKPLNLVLINNQVKIIDFDIAKITQLDITQELSGVKGTEIYMDPNLIHIWNQINFLDDNNPEIRYNLEKMEIYSIGCTFLKLAMKWNANLYRRYYFDTNDYFNNKQYQEQEHYLGSVTKKIQNQQLKQILCKMLVLDLKQRWNLEECILEQQLQQKQQLQNQNQQQQLQQKQQLQYQNQQQQIKKVHQNQYQEYLSNQQIQQLEKEKLKILLKEDIILKEKDVPQTRYLYIQSQCNKKKIEQLNNSICHIVYKQINLIKLDIHIGYACPYIQKAFLQIISNIPHLMLLGLSINEYNYPRNFDMISVIGEGLKELPTLQKLQLQIGANQIVQGAMSIGQALQKQTNLQELYLEIYQQNINARGAQGIALGIEKLATLQQLSLIIYSNKLGENGAKSLAQAIQKLSNLQQLLLVFKSNYIGDNGAKSIANSIQNLTALKYLHLETDNNQIGEYGATSIAQALEKLSNLHELRLEIDSNKIGDNGAKAIGQALQKLTSLQNLNLVISSNQIGHIGAMGIEKGLEKLTNLRKLRLQTYESNFIKILQQRNTGNDDIGIRGEKCIASAVLKLPYLDDIDIQMNQKYISNKQELQRLL